MYKYIKEIYKGKPHVKVLGTATTHYPLSVKEITIRSVSQISKYRIRHHPLTFVCEPVKEIAIRSFSFHKYSQYISEKRPMSRFWGYLSHLSGLEQVKLLFLNWLVSLSIYHTCCVHGCPSTGIRGRFSYIYFLFGSNWKLKLCRNWSGDE